MYTKKGLLCLGIVAITHINIFSQLLSRPDYLIEIGTSGSMGRETPFWLISNQNGLITPEKYNGWIKLGIHSPISNEKKLDYFYSFEVVDRYSNDNELYMHQAYLGLKLYFINIQAGRIVERFGNQDSSLSSGGLLWSGNTVPMPKVSVIIPEYTKVPYTNGLFEFKGGISHGWFDNNQFVKHTWLHHKYAYLQFGGENFIHIHYGFHHFAQWGGKKANGEQLPSGLSDYAKVFLARKGGWDAPPSDEVNALGNHIGSHNFGIDIDLGQYNTGFYWQTIFEDSSGMAFKNIKDGLWGIFIHSKDKNKILNGFVYEFINTTNQSGPYKEYWELNGNKYLYPVEGGEYHNTGGFDNYFNNWLYEAGWTYQDMTIGTPLITSPKIKHGTSSNYIMNNKVTGHHFGIEGKYKNMSYKIFYTYYLNYGTINYPIETERSQHSILIQNKIYGFLPWGIDVCLKGGVDIGGLYGNNAGLQISLTKNGSF